jgi:hypothetical protein
VTNTILDELREQFDLERSIELDHFARTGELLDSPYPKTILLLRKAIAFSRQNPQLSIPNEWYYPFGNTELTQRLELAENSHTCYFPDALNSAMEAIKPVLSPEERLEALIAMGSQ